MSINEVKAGYYWVLRKDKPEICEIVIYKPEPYWELWPIGCDYFFDKKEVLFHKWQILKRVPDYE